MAMLDPDNIVVAVRYKGDIRWFRSDRDLWVLDVNKWRDEFISYGYEVPDFNSQFRFGFRVVNQDNAQRFLDAMAHYEVTQDSLSVQLAQRYSSAQSWWDVQDLFPIMFVNFDRCEAGAFYPEGTPMERYLPDGWKGEFIDFANDYPEEIFPVSAKFWIKNGCDLLALLIKREKAN